MLGTIEARQERFVEAAQAFQRAVDLEPENRFYRQNFERVDAINNAGR